jgi:hypothetical protein
MREKLIELIQNADTYDGHECKLCTKDDVSCGRCGAEKLADHLLADGVIVPPVKVGQTVYKISRNKVKGCEVVFVGLSADEKCSHFIFVENYADGTFYKSYSMGFNLIGKTVFLTREDAEKALKGGAE